MTAGFPGTKHVPDPHYHYKGDGMCFYESVGNTCQNHDIHFGGSGLNMGETVRERLKNFVQSEDTTNIMKQRSLSWVWQTEEIDTPALYALYHLGHWSNIARFGSNFDLHLVATLLYSQGIPNRVVKHEYDTNIYKHVMPLALGDSNLREVVLSSPQDVQATDLVIVHARGKDSGHWVPTKYIKSAPVGMLLYEKKLHQVVGLSATSAIELD